MRGTRRSSEASSSFLLTENVSTATARVRSMFAGVNFRHRRKIFAEPSGSRPSLHQQRTVMEEEVELAREGVQVALRLTRPMNAPAQRSRALTIFIRPHHQWHNCYLGCWYRHHWDGTRFGK